MKCSDEYAFSSELVIYTCIVQSNVKSSLKRSERHTLKYKDGV